MKSFRIIFAALFTMLFSVVSAQNGNVVAKSRDISDNLDLQAVASVFGESKDLEDFERKLNDPSLQISNLDLNQDGYVDYLRVLEVAEGDTRVVVIQAVLGQDQFQDVATIEMQRQKATASNSSSNVTIQIVGNPYIYGPNYIYEPYYYRPPVFFDFFWLATYRPYYSPWYWGYYPTYYSYWAPVPYYRYNRNVYRHINQNNRYVYTDTRRVSRADRLYSNVRGNSLERQNPGRSFETRNANVSNRYAYDKERTATRTNTISNDRASFSSNRGEITPGRATSDNGRQANDLSSSRVSNSDVRSTGTRVRSDFNANRSDVSRETRVSLPSSTRNNNFGSSSETSRSMNFGSSPALQSSNNRIERAPRTSSDSGVRSSNSSSINRSSNMGSFNRSSSSMPSRSTSAPSRPSSGSSGSGRSIGR